MSFSLPASLSESLVWTVAYTSQFSYPLRETEIGERLVMWQSQKKDLPPKQLHRTLLHLVKQKKLATKNDFFFLPGQVRQVGIRQQRAKISAAKWAQVEKFVQWVNWVPWIHSIWVTGSLAMKNAQTDQDIDFMIMTAAHRLWLTRLLVTMLVLAVGKKRAPHGKETQTWCFNLWLDEEHLQLPIEKRNVYTAYEVMQTKVVFDRGESARKFWNENKWVRKFLVNWKISSPNHFQTALIRSSRLKCSLEKVWGGILDFIENFAFHFQYLYMQRRLTTEQVAPGYAFFHPRPTAQLVFHRWQRRVKKLK